MAAFLKLLTGVCSLGMQSAFTDFKLAKTTLQIPLEAAAPITPLCFIFHYFGVHII